MAKVIDTGIQTGDVVTIPFENLVSSNTFIVDTVVGDDALLYHPLFPKILVKEQVVKLNKVQANLKDSTERSLDFANNNKKYLDYNTTADLESLCTYFVVRRKLTPRQKSLLSSICGKIAGIKFNDNIQEAMNLIKKNEGVLDDFNGMWYRNFKSLFVGRQPITSKKQRDAIFNIAGFVLAELETPVAPK